MSWKSNFKNVSLYPCVGTQKINSNTQPYETNNQIFVVYGILGSFFFLLLFSCILHFCVVEWVIYVFSLSHCFCSLRSSLANQLFFYFHWAYFVMDSFIVFFNALFICFPFYGFFNSPASYDALVIWQLYCSHATYFVVFCWPGFICYPCVSCYMLCHWVSLTLLRYT